MELEHYKLLAVTEHKFHPKRKWRFDFAWPDIKFAVEVEGGIYSGGRHTRGSGFEKDLEKYAEALMLDWRVLRLGAKQILSGEALEMIRFILNKGKSSSPRLKG